MTCSKERTLTGLLYENLTSKQILPNFLNETDSLQYINNEVYYTLILMEVYAIQ